MTRSNEASVKSDLLETLARNADLKAVRETVDEGAKGAWKAFDQGWEWLTGTPDDPTAFRLGWEWLTEKGPEHRELDESHQFTQRFMRSPMVAQIRNAIYRKYDGHPPDGGSYTDFGANMDWEYLDPNAEQQFLGSFVGDAYIRDGRIYFEIENESDLHSLFGGHFIEDFNKKWGTNIPTAPERKREEWGPGGQTSQRITWSEPVVPRTPEEMDELEPAWWEFWK